MLDVRGNGKRPGGDARLEEFDGSVNVAHATSVVRRMVTQESERWFCELGELVDSIHG